MSTHSVIDAADAIQRALEDTGPVELSDLLITGKLILRAKELRSTLTFAGCTFEEVVDLSETRGKTVRFTNCTIPELEASGLDLAGDLVLDGSNIRHVSLDSATIADKLSLAGTHLGGDEVPARDTCVLHAERMRTGRVVAERCKAAGGLSLVSSTANFVTLHGAEIDNPDGYALEADGLRVAGDMLFWGGFRATGEIRLVHAHIGTLSLRGATVECGNRTAVNVNGATVTQGIFLTDGFRSVGNFTLRRANVRILNVMGAQLNNPGGCALDGEWMTVEQALFADDARVSGQVRLVKAQLRGEMRMRRACIQKQDGVALDCDGMTVAGSFEAPSIQVQGEVRLSGARVGGWLDLQAAVVGSSSSERPRQQFGPDDADDESRAAIDGTELTVDRGVHADRLKADGPILLQGASANVVSFDCAQLRGPLVADRMTVRGGLFARKLNGESIRAQGAIIRVVTLDDAQLGTNESHPPADDSRSEPTGLALDCERLTVEDAMSCRNFKAKGGVSLREARAAKLILRDAEVDALDLADAEIARFTLALAQPVKGVVDLQRTRVGTFVDASSSWWTKSNDRVAGEVLLNDLTYDHLDDQATMGVNERLKWLALDRSPSIQPFEQLAAHYRRVGSHAEADKVAIASQRAKREALTTRAGRLWNDFMRITVGYGYEFRRTLYFLIPLLIVGTLVFSLQYPEDFRRARDGANFEPLIFTVDVLIPVLQLSEKDAWYANGITQYLVLFFRACGWLLTTAVVLGIANVLRRP